MEDKIYLNNTSKALIEIWSGEDDGPENSVELTADSRRFMHVNLKQVINRYDTEGNESTEINRFPVIKCPEEAFETTYEKKFYKTFIKSHLYCVTDSNVYTQGTRDSRVLKRDHAYLVYEFTKCHD